MGTKLQWVFDLVYIMMSTLEGLKNYVKRTMFNRVMILPTSLQETDLKRSSKYWKKYTNKSPYQFSL